MVRVPNDPLSITADAELMEPSMGASLCKDAAVAHIIGGLRSRFAGQVPKITTEDRLQWSATQGISIFVFH